MQKIKSWNVLFHSAVEIQKSVEPCCKELDTAGAWWNVNMLTMFTIVAISFYAEQKKKHSWGWWEDHKLMIDQKFLSMSTNFNQICWSQCNNAIGWYVRRVSFDKADDWLLGERSKICVNHHQPSLELRTSQWRKHDKVFSRVPF